MPQQRLPAVPINSGGDDRPARPLSLQAIGAAGKLLADRGLYGMVWLDRELVVRARFGRLIDFIAEGCCVTDSVPALIGLEDDIRALEGDPSGVVDLPAVAIMSASRATPRLNISIYWYAEMRGHLMVISRAVARADLEAQLIAQMRARLMAEDEVSAKSRALARANTELSRANADLEDFASIISHDLGGPMRAMRYLIDDLETAIGRALSNGGGRPSGGQGQGTAAAELARLRAQTLRLSTMLRDLHEYSSIGRKQEAIETVDTRALVDSVVAAIHRPPGFKVCVSGDWPQLETLAAPLDVVLRNLIENALKHHNGNAGTVQVTAADRGQHLLISVRDDGPGIDAASREAVFLPFRTLGQKGAGTGMGLAFVRRTIEAVGGSLSLISHPELATGAEFLILWPKTLTN